MMPKKEDSICWNCKRSCDKSCSWAREFIPVEGWEAEYCEKYKSYRVNSCPLFLSDENEEWEIDEKGALMMIERLMEITRDDYIHCPRLQPEIEKFLRGRGASKVHMIGDPETVIKQLKNDYKRYISGRMRAGRII